MKENNAYRYMELIFTLGLFLILILLYGSALPYSGLFFALCIISAFVAAFYTQDQVSPVRNIIMNVAVMAVFGWFVHTFLNSAFLYKNIMLLCVKGGFLLATILAVSAFRQRTLSYLQVISVLLFWCLPVFIKDFSPAVVIKAFLFIVICFAILKIKFYRLAHSPIGGSMPREYSTIIAVAIFICGVIISCMALTKSLVYRSGGGIFRLGATDMEDTFEKLEENYYRLQDGLQNETTVLINKTDSVETARQVLSFIERLIKNSADTVEVESAHQGLVSLLKEPGPGLEKNDTEQILTLANDYLETKALLNMQISRNKAMEVLKSNPLNIKDRVLIYQSTSRIQKSDTSEGAVKNAKNAYTEIMGSSLDKELKKEEKTSVVSLKEWKLYQLYLKKMKELKQKISEEGKEMRDPLFHALGNIEKMSKSSSLKQVQEQMESLAGLAVGAQKNIIEDMEEVLSLKVGMLMAQKNRTLKKGLEKTNLSKVKLDQAEKTIDELEYSVSAAKLEDNHDDLKAILEELENVEIEGRHLPEQGAADLDVHLDEQVISQQLDSLMVKSDLQEAFAREDFNQALEGIKRAENMQDLDLLQKKIDDFRSSASSSGQRLIIIELEKLYDAKKDLVARSSGKKGGRKQETGARQSNKGISAGAGSDNLSEAGVQGGANKDNAAGQASSGHEEKAMAERLEKQDLSRKTDDLTAKIDPQGQSAREGLNTAAGAESISIGSKSDGVSDGFGQIRGAEGSGGGKGTGGDEITDKRDSGDDVKKQKMQNVELELVKIEAQRAVGEKKDEIKKHLDSSNPETKKELAGRIDKLSQTDSLKGLEEETGSIEGRIDKLQEQGVISRQLGDNLANSLKELSGYLAIGFNLEQEENFSKEGAKNEQAERDEGVEAIEKNLVAIKIIPESQNFAFGASGEIIAQGVLSDKTEIDLTSAVEWVSQDESVARVSKHGQVQGVSVGSAGIYAQISGIKSNNAIVTVDSAKLISILLSPSDPRISMFDQLTLKAEGYYSDDSLLDLTGEVLWHVSKPRILKIEKGKINPLIIGETAVNAKYGGVESLPVKVSVIVTWEWIFVIAAKVFGSILLAASAAFLVLYLIAEQAKQRLCRLMHSDPRGFIIALYRNLNELLSILSPQNLEFIPPLELAVIAENKYGISDRTFIRFTERFEEANYSKHQLGEDKATLALDEYNRTVKAVLCHYKGAARVFRYIKILCCRVPLSMNCR